MSVSEDQLKKIQKVCGIISHLLLSQLDLVELLHVLLVVLLLKLADQTHLLLWAVWVLLSCVLLELHGCLCIQSCHDLLPAMRSKKKRGEELEVRMMEMKEMRSHEVAAKNFQLPGTDSAPHRSDGIMTDLLLLLHTESLLLCLSPLLLLPSESLLLLQSTPLLLLPLPFPLLLLLPPTLLFFFSEGQQKKIIFHRWKFIPVGGSKQSDAH